MMESQEDECTNIDFMYPVHTKRVSKGAVYFLFDVLFYVQKKKTVNFISSIFIRKKNVNFFFSSQKIKMSYNLFYFFSWRRWWPFFKIHLGGLKMFIGRHSKDVTRLRETGEQFLCGAFIYIFILFRNFFVGITEVHKKREKGCILFRQWYNIYTCKYFFLSV